MKIGDKVRIRKGTARAQYIAALGIGIVYRVNDPWADVQWDGISLRGKRRHHKIKNLEPITDHENGHR